LINLRAQNQKSGKPALLTFVCKFHLTKQTPTKSCVWTPS